MPPKKKKIDPSFDPLQNIMKADLSDNSKENYAMRAHTLSKKADKPLIDIILNPKTYIRKLNEWYPKDTSRKAHLSFILAIFRYNPDMTCDHRDVYEKWSGAFTNTHQQVINRYELNKPSDRQMEGYVPYADIIKKRDELEPGSIERLLLGFYTYLKPLRCDFGMVRLYNGRLPAEKEREKNYILLKDDKAILNLSAYKTSKTYGTHELELPELLRNDLLESLKKDHREWLFVDSDGKPQSRNTYCVWTLRLFKKLFGKPLTVSLIRHSFINQLNMSELSIKEKKDIAHQMGHNIQTQDVYRLIFQE
ncbi:hypothetical protein [Dishui Lake large algae virus 1]|nr:hypothetical protein [Dishui Lake large algae virus 1]